MFSRRFSWNFGWIPHFTIGNFWPNKISGFQKFLLTKLVQLGKLKISHFRAAISPSFQKTPIFLFFYFFIGMSLVGFIVQNWGFEVGLFDFWGSENDPKNHENAPQSPIFGIFQSFFPVIIDPPGGHNYAPKKVWPTPHMASAGHFQVYVVIAGLTRVLGHISAHGLPSPKISRIFFSW